MARATSRSHRSIKPDFPLGEDSIGLALSSQLVGHLAVWELDTAFSPEIVPTPREVLMTFFALLAYMELAGLRPAMEVLIIK